MNRSQMIINAAVAAGRKVVLDGRGMLNYAEIAVRQGILKVPKGTIIPITQAGTIAEDKLLVMCTGGQGEPNAALQRMSDSEHKSITLHQGDTVVVSSSPIPGNEVSYDSIGNKLSKRGVHLFRHPTHELDGCGPLHVSGHARRGELREMLQLTRPKFFIPVHGGMLRRRYHADLAVEEGLQRQNVFLPDNGDSFLFTLDEVKPISSMSHGSILIDQTGAEATNKIIKDRLLLRETGLITILLTIEQRTGQLTSNPVIVSRGFDRMDDSSELMQQLQSELRRAVNQRFKRIPLERFKQEISDFVSQVVFAQTSRNPMVIPVVSVMNTLLAGQSVQAPKTQIRNSNSQVDQKRYQDMRARLLVGNKRD